MKIFLTLLIMPLMAVAAVCQQHSHNVKDGIFQPPRISLQELLDHKDTSSRDFLKGALADIGMLSITDIPGFGREKPETLQAFASCVSMEEQDSAAAKQMFADGTIRQTIGTSGVGSDLIFLTSSEKTSADCHHFQQVSKAFRDTVADVTRTVGYVLSELIPEPLLKDTNEKSFDWKGIVNAGNHLEHFHLYSKPASSSTAPKTIDWHTDQGLMLIFSPGLVQGMPSQKDFYIQLADGTPAAVNFDVQDELVILLGDGVNQYVNNRASEEENITKLRAVPHSLSMEPSTTTEEAAQRVWYGRMVLPPAQAVHPVHQETFEEIARQLNTDPSNPESAALGCASFANVERHLQDATEDSCNADSQHLCWHQCMNYTDFDNISPDACAERDLEVACANDENELWANFHAPNNEFTLKCLNMSTAVFADPPLATDSDDSEHDHSTHDHGDEEEGEMMDDSMMNSGAVVLSVVSMSIALVALASLVLLVV